MLRRLLKNLRFRSAGRPVEDALAGTPHEGAATREALYARGQALEGIGRFAQAVECYRACAEIDPHDLAVHAAIANALSASWRMEECIAACEAGADIAPDNASVLSCHLLYSHYAARPDPEALFRLHAAYGERYGRAHPPNGPRRDVDADPARALAVGYVSRDFCQHSVASFIEPVLEHHDRRRFRVHCYYTRRERDAVTERIARGVEVWHDAHADDADALARRIRKDRIDILIDLGGHTPGGALPVFARQPAPVQLTWLGYPDTTGLATVDYRITDRVADPPPLADAFHSERLLRLEPPFLCYRPPADSPPIEKPAKRSSAVFGSFNVVMKVNGPLLDRWAQILHAVPGSTMLIKSTLLEHDETRERLAQDFAARGVHPGRIELRPLTPARGAHLAAYNEVDIALDTYPYNGTTTTCEALWMGTPVVTRSGDLHMARVGATLLESAGLQELVARSGDDYVTIAVALAQDTARRAALTNGMRRRLETSPLFDYAGFTRRLEGALAQAWSAWCASRSAGR